MDRPAHVLTYDTLPPHSRLRRTVQADGSILIASGIGEPSEVERDNAMRSTALSSGTIALGIMAVLALVFGPMASERVGRLPMSLRLTLMLCAGVFCVALFLLVWKLRYGRRLEALERAAAQSTAVVATPGRLLVESTGPLGPHSVTLRTIGDAGSFVSRPHPATGLPCLEARSDDGKSALLFPGLTRAEFRWVASELRLALTAPDPGTDQPLPPTTTTISTFNGLGLHLGNLHQLSNARTRSISPENFGGEKGKGGMATEGTGSNASRDLGRGWKVSPSIVIKPKEEREIANIVGPGAVQQIWMTPTGNWRWDILRIY